MPTPTRLDDVWLATLAGAMADFQTADAASGQDIDGVKSVSGGARHNSMRVDYPSTWVYLTPPFTAMILPRVAPRRISSNGLYSSESCQRSIASMSGNSMTT